MPKMLNDKIKAHLMGNLLSYIILTLFFILGTICGAYISTTYDAEQTKSLGSFLDDVIKIFESGSIDYNAIFRASFFSSAKSVLFIWLLGFTVIGVIVILFMIFKCGFMLGFISTFLISFYSYKGLLGAVLIILAQSVLYIPILFVMSTYGLSLSSLLIKMITGKIKYRANFKYYILQYSLVALFSVVILIVYALFEAYIAANLIKWSLSLNW